MAETLSSVDLESVQLAPIRTMRISKASSQLGDNEALLIQNYVPYEDIELRKIPSWGEYYDLNTLANPADPGNITKLYNFQILNVPYLAVFTDQSYFYVLNLSTDPPVGTYVGDGFSGAPTLTNCRQWKNTHLLIIDNTKGYYSWTTEGGAGLVAIDANWKGELIEVWQGSVWLRTGTNRTLYFSAPDSYTDFTTASGGGVFILNHPSLKGGIRQIAATPDVLYVLGEEATFGIDSLYTSPDTGRSTFRVNDLQMHIGCTSPNSVQVIGNILFTKDRMGLWQLTGYSPERVSKHVDEALRLVIPNANVVGAVTNVYDLPMYSILTPLVNPYTGIEENWMLCLMEGKWFVVNYDLALNYICHNYTNLALASCFGAYGPKVIEMFKPNGTNPVEAKLLTKKYDDGHPHLVKQVDRFGMVVNPDQDCSFFVEVEGDYRSYSLSLDFEGIDRAIHWWPGETEPPDTSVPGNEVIWYAGEVEAGWPAGDRVTWLGASLFVGTALGQEKQVRSYGRGKYIGFSIEEKSQYVHSITAIKYAYFPRVEWHR